MANSHILYKLKMNEDGSLKLKVRNVSHGNEDDLKDILTSDCSLCLPTRLRIVESIASLLEWNLYKADINSTFLQTGSAVRDRYVKPLRESTIQSSHFCYC